MRHLAERRPERRARGDEVRPRRGSVQRRPVPLRDGPDHLRHQTRQEHPQVTRQAEVESSFDVCRHVM